MAFPEEVKEAALERCGGRCECTRPECTTHYLTRCSTHVTIHTAFFRQRKEFTLGDVEGLSNCEVLCQSCDSNAQMASFSGG